MDSEIQCVCWCGRSGASSQSKAPTTGLWQVHERLVTKEASSPILSQSRHLFTVSLALSFDDIHCYLHLQNLHLQNLHLLLCCFRYDDFGSLWICPHGRTVHQFPGTRNSEAQISAPMEQKGQAWSKQCRFKHHDAMKSVESILSVTNLNKEKHGSNIQLCLFWNSVHVWDVNNNMINHDCFCFSWTRVNPSLLVRNCLVSFPGTVVGTQSSNNHQADFHGELSFHIFPLLQSTLVGSLPLCI